MAAIEGFQREHGSAPEHTGSNELLGRVMRELHGAGPPPSPGQRAAHNAAMGAEVGHPGGDGQVMANKPGSAHQGEPAPDIHGSSERSDHMTATAPAPSKGNVLSAMPGGAAGGARQIRRIAAERETSRRDTKFGALKGAGENNKESNPSGEGYPGASRVGAASSGVKVLGSGDHDADDYERAPARTAQQRNPFARAGDGVRARMRGK
jgi:hypothetical protein